jgi:hypothetical protein
VYIQITIEEITHKKEITDRTRKSIALPFMKMSILKTRNIAPSEIPRK